MPVTLQGEGGVNSESSMLDCAEGAAFDCVESGEFEYPLSDSGGLYTEVMEHHASTAVSSELLLAGRKMGKV